METTKIERQTAAAAARKAAAEASRDSAAAAAGSRAGANQIDLTLALVVVIAIVFVIYLNPRRRFGVTNKPFSGPGYAPGYAPGSTEMPDSPRLDGGLVVDGVDPVVTGRLHSGPRAAGPGRRYVTAGSRWPPRGRESPPPEESRGYYDFETGGARLNHRPGLRTREPDHDPLST